MVIDESLGWKQKNPFLTSSDKTELLSIFRFCSVSILSVNIHKNNNFSFNIERIKKSQFKLTF
jgi:hypothetical protein